jgi:hypothetical protein
LELAIKENEVTMEEIKLVTDNLFLEISSNTESYVTFEEFKKVVVFEDSVFQKFTIEFDILGKFVAL